MPTPNADWSLGQLGPFIARLSFGVLLLFILPKSSLIVVVVPVPWSLGLLGLGSGVFIFVGKKSTGIVVGRLERCFSCCTVKSCVSVAAVEAI